MSLYLMSCRSRQLLGFLELGKTDANSVTMYWSAPLLLIVCFVKVEFFTQQNAYSLLLCITCMSYKAFQTPQGSLNFISY